MDCVILVHPEQVFMENSRKSAASPEEPGTEPLMETEPRQEQITAADCARKAEKSGKQTKGKRSEHSAKRRLMLPRPVELSKLPKMTEEELRDLLEQVWLIDGQIGTKTDELLELRQLRGKCTSVLTGMPGGRNPDRRPVEEIAARVDALEQEITTDIARLADKKTTLYLLIRAVRNPEYRLLLEQRYVIGNSWQMIADNLNYSVRWVTTAHVKAVEELCALACKP